MLNTLDQSSASPPNVELLLSAMGVGTRAGRGSSHEGVVKLGDTKGGGSALVSKIEEKNGNADFCEATGVVTRIALSRKGIVERDAVKEDQRRVAFTLDRPKKILVPQPVTNPRGKRQTARSTLPISKEKVRVSPQQSSTAARSGTADRRVSPRKSKGKKKGPVVRSPSSATPSSGSGARGKGAYHRLVLNTEMHKIVSVFQEHRSDVSRAYGQQVADPTAAKRDNSISRVWCALVGAESGVLARFVVTKNLLADPVFSSLSLFNKVSSLKYAKLPKAADLRLFSDEQVAHCSSTILAEKPLSLTKVPAFIAKVHSSFNTTIREEEKLTGHGAESDKAVRACWEKNFARKPAECSRDLFGEFISQTRALLSRVTSIGEGGTTNQAAPRASSSSFKVERSRASDEAVAKLDALLGVQEKGTAEGTNVPEDTILVRPQDSEAADVADSGARMASEMISKYGQGVARRQSPSSAPRRSLNFGNSEPESRDVPIGLGDNFEAGEGKVVQVASESDDEDDDDDDDDDNSVHDEDEVSSSSSKSSSSEDDDAKPDLSDAAELPSGRARKRVRTEAVNTRKAAVKKKNDLEKEAKKKRKLRENKKQLSIAGTGEDAMISGTVVMMKSLSTAIQAQAGTGATGDGGAKSESTAIAMNIVSNPELSNVQKRCLLEFNGIPKSLIDTLLD